MGRNQLEGGESRDYSVAMGQLTPRAGAEQSNQWWRDIRQRAHRWAKEPNLHRVFRPATVNLMSKSLTLEIPGDVADALRLELSVSLYS